MKRALSGVLIRDLEQLKKMFGGSMDLYTKEVTICGIPCGICMFDGLSSTTTLWLTLLDRLSQKNHTVHSGMALYHSIMQEDDFAAEPTPVCSFDDLVRRITSGFSVLLIDGCTKGIAISTQSMVSRSVGEPSGEGNIHGSREGFTEMVRTNVSLLRRLIRRESLVIKFMTCGQRTKTELALCFDRELANPELVKKIEQQLSSINLPILLDSSYLAPFLQHSGRSFFSEVGYTERPATASAKICEGKLVILVNGSPFAMILPYFFTEHFQSLDDYSSKAYFCSFVRILKYFAFALAILLPGAFVCAVQFTPEIFPPQLLYKIAAAERATPWPLFLEMVLVILLLEVVREAGLRLPKPIGHSVGLVAALIVGDAAIGAGILSTPVMIIAALTSISMFVIPSLYEPATVLRILYVFAGGLLGPAGLIALFMVMMLSICGMGSFGIPFTSPLAPWGPGSYRDGIFRVSWRNLSRAPFVIEDLPKGELHDDNA